ncbi:MAG: hypothetical protein R3Y56_10640 [Akkermansia sp.]
MSLLKPSQKKAKPQSAGRAGKKSASSSRAKSKGKKASADKTAKALAYSIPPVILLAIFGYCATHTFVPAPKPKAAPVVAAASSAHASAEPDDLNNNLPNYTWSAPQSNLLSSSSAKVSQSAGGNQYAASYAIDGSTNNDAKVAQSIPSNGQSWWKAEFINGSSRGAIATLVIYGGGSASPVGKLKGGFEVTVEGANGQNYTRRFCEEGFALEGYEAWTLDVPTKLRSITITSLKTDAPLVLREVQAIGTL